MAKQVRTPRDIAESVARNLPAARLALHEARAQQKATADRLEPLHRSGLLPSAELQKERQQANLEARAGQ